MQHIEEAGHHVAEWGGFEVHLQLYGAGRCSVEIKRAGESVPVVVMPDIPRRGASEGITWASRWLETAGASVLVDGRSRSLADFLSFRRTG